MMDGRYARLSRLMLVGVLLLACGAEDGATKRGDPAATPQFLGYWATEERQTQLGIGHDELCLLPGGEFRAASIAKAETPSTEAPSKYWAARFASLAFTGNAARPPCYITTGSRLPMKAAAPGSATMY